MNKLFFTTLVLICLALGSLPSVTQAQSIHYGSEYQSVLIRLIELLQKQVIVLQSELNSRLLLEESIFEMSGIFSSNVESVGRYKVDKVGGITFIKNDEHRQYFARVFELFPDEYDYKLDYLLVFSGEDSKVDAFVETLPPTHKQWLFAVNDELVLNEYSDANTELIIHELSHIISFEETESVLIKSEVDCNDLLRKYGCPSESSYLKLFINEFWSSHDLSRVDNFSYSEDSLDQVYNYHKKHKTEYVTSYAAVSPAEDFSESLMFFLLNESVSGKIAKKKLSFFAEYPELVILKKGILNRL